jgi:hypothetical protein
MLVAGLVAGGSTVASAQEVFTPVFKAPYRAFTNYEIGGMFSDPEGADYALEGFYGVGRGRNDFGLRVAYHDFGGGDAIALGGSFRTRVLQYSTNFPLDGALTLGAGVIFGDGFERFTVPVGLSLGRRVLLEGSSTSFVPYIHPIMAPSFGSGDSEVDFALGLGVDIRFGQNLDVRVSAGLGADSWSGVGVGLAFVR